MKYFTKFLYTQLIFSIFTINIFATDFTCANPKEFTSLFTSNIYGKLIITGNTSLCKDNGHGVCADPGTATNNHINMMNIDYDDINGTSDNSATTLNSSAAYLDIPAGKKVLWAGLTWQGYMAGTWTDAQKEAGHQIKYKHDSDTKYQVETNATMNWVYFNSTRMYYQGFVNITDYVNTHKGGYYWVGDIATSEGKPAGGSFGAWSITVVYEDDNADFNNIAVYSGYQAFASSGDRKNAKSYANNNGCDASKTGVGNQVSSTLTGFLTPKSGTVTSSLVVFAGEGDIGLSGDWGSVTDVNNTEHRLSNAKNPIDNIMNATISKDGLTVTSGLPYYSPNSLGADIDTFDTSSIMSHNQTTTDIKFSTNGDGYMPGLYGLQTKLYTPEMCYDYSLKQDGQYLNIDRNSYPIARIDSKVSSSDIGVTIYLRNEESDIAAEGISIKSDANASMFNQTGNMYSSNVNGSALLDRGTPTTSTPLCDYNTSLDNSTSNSGCTDGHNVRKGLGALNAQDYIYTKYTVKPSGVSGITDINESLGLSLDYYIDINGSAITYNDYTLGGKNVPLCPLSSSYTPTWGQFNVVASGLQTNNLNTQISRKAFSTDVIFDSDTTTGKNDAPSTDINTTVLTEIIDVDAFGDLNASCANPDSSVSTPIFVPVSFNSSTYQTPIPAQTDDYYNFAVKNAAFRVWYFTDDNGTLIQNWNAFTTNHNQTLSSISGLYDPATHTACASDCTVPTSTTCFTCIKNNYAKPLCSRDNFSVRPESYDMRVYDVNNSLPAYDITTNPTNPKNTTKIDLSDLYHYDPLHAAATGRIDLAAGYAYRFDMNATGHNGISSVPGYTRYFNGGSDYNITEIWDPQSAVTGCNDTSNVNMPLYIANGVAQNDERIRNNVGEYRLNIIDTTWTAVDWQNLTHHDTSTDGGFLAGTDCIQNSNSSTLVGDEYGCTIISNHGADGGGRVYKDNDLTFHPYEFAVSNTVTLGKGNSGAGVSPAVMPEPAKPFVYMSNLSQDENMSVHLNTTVTAKGRNSTAGLTNYVTGCFAKPINLTIAKTATTNLALAFNYLVHNKDSNGTILPVNDINKTIVAGNTAENPAFTTTSSFFQKDQNGTIQLLTNLNYKRDVNVTANPEDINFTTISADDNATLFNADLTANKFAEGNATVNQRVLYYYGRTIAPKITVVCNANTCRTGISTTNNNNIKELISYAIFCQGATCNSTILPTGALQVGDIRWFENRNHDRSGQPLTTDGGIGTVTEVSNTGNVVEISRAISAVNYENEDVIQYTGPLPYDAVMQMQSSPWLIYNETDNNATANQFIIQFVGDGGWSGKHEDNTTTKTNFSTTTNRRIMW